MLKKIFIIVKTTSNISLITETGPDYSLDLHKYFFISFSTAGMGSSIGPSLHTGTPVLSMMNLEKFHLMAFIKNPACFSLRKVKRGSAALPLTSILEKSSN